MPELLETLSDSSDMPELETLSDSSDIPADADADADVESDGEMPELETLPDESDEDYSDMPALLPPLPAVKSKSVHPYIWFKNDTMKNVFTPVDAEKN